MTGLEVRDLDSNFSLLIEYSTMKLARSLIHFIPECAKQVWGIILPGPHAS